MNAAQSRMLKLFLKDIVTVFFNDFFMQSFILWFFYREKRRFREIISIKKSKEIDGAQ